MIALARKTLIHEWRRFVPAVLAVGFSGVLLVVQAALVLGIFGSAAIYVTASSADLWAGYPGTQSVNFGRALDPDVEMRLRLDPAVTAVEPYLWVDGEWSTSDSSKGSVSIYLSGISTRQQSLMFSRVLTPELRNLLREPDAVIVDPADLDTLGTQVGGRAWINAHQVNVVAVVPGLRGLGGVNVLASLDTARGVGGADSVAGNTYYVAHVRPGVDAARVRDRLMSRKDGIGPVEIWTAPAFAQRSQWYWLLDTGAGVAVLFMALIVCLVGAVITSQSLASVVAGSAREYAMLNALGASRMALGRVVVEQSFWIGGLGLVMAVVISAGLLVLAAANDVPVSMTPAVGCGCLALLAGLVLCSGLVAVRSLMRADPTLLLR